MNTETFYFSHDYNARNDDKIKQLIRKHGMVGYGVYWAIVEDLYQNANAMRCDCDGIAFDLRVQSDIVHSVLHDYNLFIHDGGMFGSASVQRRLDVRNDRSQKARESARKRWGIPDDANAMQSHSEGIAINESKIKESKIKDKDTAVTPHKQTRPELDDVVTYARHLGCRMQETPEKFYDYYTANGWKVGRNPMKDWKAAFRNWVKNEPQYEHGTHIKATNNKSVSSRTQSDWDALKDWGSEFDSGGGIVPPVTGSDPAEGLF